MRTRISENSIEAVAVKSRLVSFLETGSGGNSRQWPEDENEHGNASEVAGQGEEDICEYDNVESRRGNRVRRKNSGY